MNLSGLRERAVRFVRDFVPERPAGSPAVDRELLVVYLSGALLLTVFAYYGRSGGFRGTDLHSQTVLWLGELGERFDALLPYAWWGVCSLVLRVLVPVLILLALGYRLREMGLGLGVRRRGAGKDHGRAWEHARIYLLLYLIMLPFLLWAATQGAFQAKYPLWVGARDGGVNFWAFQFFYALQFIGVEFFFRGFLLFPLHRRVGNHALFIAMIPYVMVHFGKPFAETVGAIVAGVVLGALALRSRTIWYGVLLHCGIAFTMDVLAIAQRSGGLGAGLRLLFGGG